MGNSPETGTPLAKILENWRKMDGTADLAKKTQPDQRAIHCVGKTGQHLEELGAKDPLN